jgi:hypothetical protein
MAFDASSTVKHKNMLTIYFCKHDRIISIRGEVVNYVFREPSVQVATPNQITRTLSTKSTSAAVSTVVIYLKRKKSASTPTASLKPGTPS